MKVKNSKKIQSKLFKRELKPRPTTNKTILITKLSCSKDQSGLTLLKIHPSQITINSNSLIKMIEEKKESISVGNGDSILRKDLLYAIYNLSCEDSTHVQHDTEDDESNSYQPDEPKRPTNAFILYRSALRKKIKSMFPSYDNNNVSKIIGAMWRVANTDIKEKYVNQALERRILHKQKYPNFDYHGKKDAPEQADGIEDLDKWNDYLDWCMQTTDIKDTRALVNSNLTDNQLQDLPQLGEPQTSYQQTSQDWIDVCNIVSTFFPEDSGQNALLDENLWSSLCDVEPGLGRMEPFSLDTFSDTFKLLEQQSMNK